MLVKFTSKTSYEIDAPKENDNDRRVVFLQLRENLVSNELIRVSLSP